MTSNVDLSVQQIQREFQALIADVTGPGTRTATAYTVDLALFRRLLALGGALLRVFFLTRTADGTSRLSAHHVLLRLRQGALRAALLHLCRTGGGVLPGRSVEPAGAQQYSRLQSSPVLPHR